MSKTSKKANVENVTDTTVPETTTTETTVTETTVPDKAETVVIKQVLPDYIPADIDKILADTTISYDDKWALVAKLADERVDFTKVALSNCPIWELNRRLKILASNKTAAKHAIEDNTDVAKVAELQDAFDAIVLSEDKIKSYKPESTRTAGVVSSDVDPATLSQIDLSKLIRNYQSKKCAANKAGDTAGMQKWQAMVDAASKFRKTSDGKPTAHEMNGKVTKVLEMLKSLPESAEVLEQIKQLEALL